MKMRPMQALKWGGIIVGVFVLLIALMAIIGALLPKSHTASRTVRLRRSAEDVYDTLVDYHAFPSWRAEVKAAAELPDGRRGWVETTRHGAMPLEIAEEDRPRKLVTRIADPKLPFGGTWTWQIAAISPEECDVTVTEDGEIYNPIFRFMARYIFGYTATMDGYVRSLGRKFGQEVHFRS